MGGVQEAVPVTFIPAGEALRDVLLGMHTIPDEGIDAQILRW
jgi:hypothetical protein